jgi:hypothetical protein
MGAEAVEVVMVIASLAPWREIRPTGDELFENFVVDDTRNVPCGGTA